MGYKHATNCCNRAIVTIVRFAPCAARRGGEKKTALTSFAPARPVATRETRPVRREAVAYPPPSLPRRLPLHRRVPHASSSRHPLLRHRPVPAGPSFPRRDIRPHLPDFFLINRTYTSNETIAEQLSATFSLTTKNLCVLFMLFLSDVGCCRVSK